MFVWFVDNRMGLDAVRASRLGTMNHTNHTNGRATTSAWHALGPGLDGFAPPLRGRREARWGG